MPNRAISSDLKRVAVRLSRIFPISIVAILTDISEDTVRRSIASADDADSRTSDSSDVPRVTRGRPRIFNEDDEKFIRGLVEQRTDGYLDELQAEIARVLNKDVSIPTLWRTLDRLNISNKRLTRPAEESRPDQRMEFLEVVAEYSADQLVFTDESYCDKRNTSRLTGWSERGTRATVPAPFKRGRRYSILPALSLDGILDVAVIEGAVNGDVFIEFIKGLTLEMNPWPEKNSVLVMDNVKFHLKDEVHELLEERGIHVVYLPPYSPDLNPIETAFSCTKAWIRRHNNQVRAAMEAEDPNEGISTLTMAVIESCTPAKALEWFRDSGYY